jgi:hypothetical protein
MEQLLCTTSTFVPKYLFIPEKQGIFVEKIESLLKILYVSDLRLGSYL